jgi:hypothetical protein
MLYIIVRTLQNLYQLLLQKLEEFQNFLTEKRNSSEKVWPENESCWQGDKEHLISGEETTNRND